MRTSGTSTLACGGQCFIQHLSPGPDKWGPTTITAYFLATAAAAICISSGSPAYKTPFLVSCSSTFVQRIPGMIHQSTAMSDDISCLATHKGKGHVWWMHNGKSCLADANTRRDTPEHSGQDCEAKPHSLGYCPQPWSAKMTPFKAPLGIVYTNSLSNMTCAECILSHRGLRILPRACPRFKSMPSVPVQLRECLCQDRSPTVDLPHTRPTEGLPNQCRHACLLLRLSAAHKKVHCSRYQAINESRTSAGLSSSALLCS